MGKRVSPTYGGPAAQGHSISGLRSPTVEFDNVSTVIDGRQILTNVNLRVPGGQTIAIMGAQRSGKTVLAQHLAGQLRPAGGRVLVGGTSIWDTEDALAGGTPSGVGTFFGASRTFDDMLDRSISVLDNLRIPLHRADDDEDAVTRKAIAWAGEWDLDTDLHAIAGDIGSVNRHRLCLAQAMVADPPLVVVDDPSAAVDIGHIIAEVESIKRWQRRTGGTIFLTTHSLRFARGLAHQVAVLRDGGIIAYGPTEEVLDGVTDVATFESRFGVILSFREADPERLRALGTELARRNKSMYADVSQLSNSGIRGEDKERPKSAYEQEMAELEKSRAERPSRFGRRRK